MNGDPIATAFFNALSITFPKGEAMFIDAVKAHRDGVPPRLAAEIRAFTQQEVIHSREHVAFNRKVEEAGYDLTFVNKQVDDIMAFIKTRPAIVNLAATIALEHYTATLAHDFLARPEQFDGADVDQVNLWKWHAIEEIEHKGVAYDTWLHATRDWSRWKRWRLKAIMMSIITVKFWYERGRAMNNLLAQDGFTGWTVYPRIWWYILGKPGQLRRALPALVKYLLPGFHPWDEDDRALISKTESEYQAAILPR